LVLLLGKLFSLSFEMIKINALWIFEKLADKSIELPVVNDASLISEMLEYPFEGTVVSKPSDMAPDDSYIIKVH
jgi:hypothetical protein